jgi:Tfp pilus assembly protein PilX
VQSKNPAYAQLNYFLKSNWDNNSTLAGTDMVNVFGVVEEPRFMIEYLGDRKQNPLATISIGGYGTQQPGDIVSIYRSTARGVGLTGNSFRFLQSYYGKKIN